MAVLSVVVVYFVLVCVKEYVFLVWLLDREDSIIISIICNSELELGVLQCQNVGDRSFIKLYITIPLYILFAGSLDVSTTYFNCHGVISSQALVTRFFFQNRSTVY